MNLRDLVWRCLPHASLVVAQFCFSGWQILGKIALNDGADSLVFALYREIFASVLMYGFMCFRQKSTRIGIDSEDRLRFVLLGLFSFVNVVGTVIALGYISATRYALFQPSIPCVAAFVSIVIGIERFTWLKACGILISVSGSVLINVWQSGGVTNSAVESNVTLGSAITAIQCSSTACLITLQKPLLKKYNSCVLTFVFYSIGSLFTIVMCACWASRFNSNSFTFGDAGMMPWYALLYASTFATLYTCNAYA